MVKNIKAIFFDIGGTLVTKANLPQRDLGVIAQMVALLDEKCTPLELQNRILAGDAEYKTWRLQTFVELSPEERWTRFLLADLPAELVRQNAETLQSLWSESRGIKNISPQALSTLKELSKRGYVLGTISHTSPKHLALAGVLPLFKSVIHAAEFGVRKPHPAPFIAAARQCGVLPSECAYVGDRPSRDVIGSREAGYELVLQIVLSDEPVESEPCPMQPDFILHNLEELLNIFLPLDTSADDFKSSKNEPLLYDVALSTSWWDKPAVSADEFFSTGRSLGFARFELNHKIPPQVLESIDLNRFHMGSLHDPCPEFIPTKTLESTDQVITSLDERRRIKAVDGVKYTIETTYRLGARYVVIHPGRIAGDHPMDGQLREMYRSGLKGTVEYQNYLQKVKEDRKSLAEPHLGTLITSLHEIFDFSKGMGLTLGLENRFYYYELPIYNEMDVLMNEFRQPWVGWHMDVGHWQVFSELGLSDAAPWLERFGNRIVGVHLHDVRGIDDHQAPGLGDVDFHSIAAVLPANCYRTIEVDKSMTKNEMAAGLKLLAKIGCINQLSGGRNA